MVFVVAFSLVSVWFRFEFFVLKMAQLTSLSDVVCPFLSGMAQQEVAWLRVRGRDGDRQLRKKLRVSLRQMASMDFDQFQQFLVSWTAVGAQKRRGD